MDELTFIKAWMLDADTQGISWHYGDVVWHWKNYQQRPEEYTYLLKGH